MQEYWFWMKENGLLLFELIISILIALFLDSSFKFQCYEKSFF